MITAGNDGGGIMCQSCDPILTNNIISSNSATRNGGGVNCRQAHVTITKCTIVNNKAERGGGISYGLLASYMTAAITNTILWSNDAQLGSEIALQRMSWVDLDYCDVTGGLSSIYISPGCVLNCGIGIIDAAPLFVDPSNSDYHLTWPSPCRDSGIWSNVIEQNDFEGDSRRWDGIPDLEADEFYAHLYSLEEVTPGSPFDLKVVGTPSTPVVLALGSGINDPPLTTTYGDLYLVFPIMRFNIGTIPPDGVLVYTTTAPGFWNPGEEKPLQALVGRQGDPYSVFTNLMVLTVE